MSENKYSLDEYAKALTETGALVEWVDENTIRVTVVPAEPSENEPHSGEASEG